MPANPTDEATFVVRGGVFPEPEHVLEAVSDALQDGFGATASVHLGQPEGDEDLQAALKRTCRESGLPHGKIRVAKSVELLEAGFKIEHDTSDGQPDCHHNVVFTEPPDLDQAKLFSKCFGDPMPNPAKD